MFKKATQDHVLALACDLNGLVCRCIADNKQFLHIAEEGFALSSIVHADDRHKLERFLRNTDHAGFAFCDDMRMARDDADYRFSFFGISKEQHLFVVAVQTPKHLFMVCNEFMGIINEQARMLRDAQKNNPAKRQLAPEAGIEHMMQLNNELANMQRELALKNMQLQEQEKRFRNLVAATPDAQIVLSEDNTILFLNPAAESMLEMDAQDARGRQCPFVFTDYQELCFQQKHQTICAEIRTTAILWENVQARLVSLRNITERKRIERIKEDIQRISQHDLISPLNSIINLPELMIEDENLQQEQVEILAMISKAGTRMLQMIRLSLDLYKMEEGTFTYTPQAVDLVKTFDDVLIDQSRNLKFRKVEVGLFTDGSPLQRGGSFSVMAESALCYSLFSNLVLNAIEASASDTPVRIELENRSGMAEIRIHNQQCVPESIRDRFFDKYVTAGKEGGTGLGTYSASLIAKTLGGATFLYSKEGHGTTVTVTLPI